MYTYHHCQQLALPQIPDNILKNLKYNVSDYTEKITYDGHPYTWSDQYNQEINQWCQENICSSIYWAFQMLTDDFAIHKDNGTIIKFVYVVEPGGSNVVTTFYSEDHNTVLEQLSLAPHTWYLLKADIPHDVQGIEAGKLRFAVTGRVF